MYWRTMLALPVMIGGKLKCQLPLCDATALVLADALVGRDRERCRLMLREALVVDPALAVWAVLNSTKKPAVSSQIGSSRAAKLVIDDFVNMLSTELPRLLAPIQRVTIIELSDEHHRRFAELVAESVGAAYQIARTDQINDLAIEPGFLSALTGRWLDWVNVAGGDRVAIKETMNWPLSMDDVLVKASAEFDGASRAKADEAWRRWLEEISAARSLLPALVEQQYRLQALESQFDEQLQTAKLESLKEFAYGAGHELNNPLANIASRAQMLLREEPDPERRRRLAAINTQAFRAHEMLADMMLYARPPKLMSKQVDLVSLIGELLAELEPAAAEQKTALHGPLRRDPCWVDVDPVQIRVALKALVANAIEALGSGGNVTIELCVTDISESTPAEVAEELVQISVTDDGPGVPPELR
ncbi:MAG TPA: HAMP domain-containing sensor histidine kinase, partial [Pirellulales bacterium]